MSICIYIQPFNLFSASIKDFLKKFIYLLQSSAVEISKIRFENIYGTSHRKPAVHIACSKSVPCTDIVLSNVHLEAADDGDGDDGDEPSTYCANVQGHAMGRVFPPLTCLS